MNTTYQDEIEIDLILLLKHLLVQWRGIVAFALIIGALVMYGRYVLDTRSYHESASEESVSEDSLKTALSENEIRDVEDAVKNKNTLNNLETYMEESVWSNLDLYRVKRVNVCYIITTDENMDAEDVISAYSNYLSADSVVEQLGKDAGYNKEAEYIREIYDINDQKLEEGDCTTRILKLNMVVADGIDESDVEKALKAAVENCDEVEKQFLHRISFVSTTVTTSADSISAFDNWENVQNLYKTLSTNQKTTVNAFSDAQRAYFEYLTSEKEKGAEDKLGKEIIAPSMRVKYFGLGVLAGGVLYAGGYMLLQIFDPRRYELTMGVNPCAIKIGCLWKNDKKRKWLNFFGRDTFLENFLFGKMKESMGKPENIVANMLMHGKSDAPKKFQVLQVGFDATSSTEFRQIEKQGEMMETEILFSSVDLENRSELLDKLKVDAQVVVSICDGKTVKGEAHKIYELLSNKGVDVVGELLII